MRKFEFRDSSAKLDIAGLQFKVELGDGLLAAKAKKIQEMANEHKEKLEKIAESNDADAVQKGVNEVCSFIQSAVDDILGAGAYESIFNGRAKNMYDHIDLLAFLLEALTDEIDELKEKQSAFDVRIEHLIKSIENLNKAMWWLIGLGGTTLVSFLMRQIEKSLMGG